MDVLKFNLSGETAFLKKPDVNTYRYLTYGHIHKVALLGILGSVLGLKGYIEQTKDETYPEFYEKLNNLKISIVPILEDNRGSFLKSFTTFNNSVGYASREEGCNLIVNEQWLYNVSWDIYVVIDSDISGKLSANLLNNKSVFIPYLGKNDHKADISDVKLFKGVNWSRISDVNSVDSLFLKEYIDIDKIKEKANHSIRDPYWKNNFIYKEFLPYELDHKLSYKYKSFIHTNREVEVKNENAKICNIDGKSLFFF